MKKIKVVVIGAGSREFSRRMINDLFLDEALKAAVGIELVLVDIDKGRLESALAYAKLCAEYTKASHAKISMEMDRRKALEGADFVIVSVAVRRMELWEQDYRVPLSFGFKNVFGENGGPGAMFHALRNFKAILPVCENMEELCPDACLINFTNPEGRILSAILKLTKIKAFGFCHGFHSLHTTAARLLERPLEELDIRTAGLNHFFTYYKMADRKTGENLIPLFERKVSENIESFDAFTRHLFEKYGVMGLTSEDHTGEYVSYAHEFMPCRWAFGIESHKVFKGFSAGTDMAYLSWCHGFGDRLDDYRASGRGERNEEYASGRRPLDSSYVKFSGELAVPVIGDIVLDRKTWRPAVNAVNSGSYISNLAKDACVELPAVVDASGLHPETVGELPEAFAALIQRQHSIQKILTQAYAERSKRLLLQALLIDPVVDSAKRAEEFLDYMLKLQADYLPEFG